MNKKILYLIAGVGVIILGILALLIGEFSLLMCGVMLLIYGVADLVKWRSGLKNGTASIWTLLGSLISFALGICILIGNVSTAQFTTTVMVVFFSLWLMVSGVFEILGAIMYRKAMTSADLGVMAPGSKTSIVSGIIMIGVGLLALIIPLVAVFTMHIWVSVGLILAGVRLITEARAAGELEETTR